MIGVLKFLDFIFSLAGKTCLGCHGRLDKTIEFKFCWLNHRSVGPGPGRDTCVLEEDTLP